ncbi:uncharacterized protein DDB_G0284459 isoform X2 [Cephus cinctus]|uniref:Uncharacterized protein DDB_G0284459 isoform X2 n=1 Tax=Cephus cinctus TaxID=211228 RepID=A0AAJ7C1L2_CEPCN|nr:uncharacterized protein DDB_G0284459 isoform X2 [Cephus cinctus]
MWFHRQNASIFYVDSDYESLGLNNDKMETEVKTLKQELARTREALRAATKRCRDLVRELDNRTAGRETERALRDQQLSRILRALLVLEGRLKQEQKSIRQLLCEKDTVIRNQQLEIAKLRRYTKNYIKSKRENVVCKDTINDHDRSADNTSTADLQSVKSDTSRSDSSLSKDIQNLKCEIITKLNAEQEQPSTGIRKTHSFAESDVSKTSVTSSENNTDVSIITTTTDSSPSLLSTEGFCEGESTDVSPGSTLNKSNRCTPTTVTDSDTELTTIDDRVEFPRRRFAVARSKPLKVYKRSDSKNLGIARTDSKDDGMDCNYASEEDEDDEDEEQDQEEPVYENACKENNARNLEKVSRVLRSSRIEVQEDTNLEENSGNWYSDPDEDRNSDEVFGTYRSNGNHNSVLECVNQILLRDREEEDNVLSVPRQFKHRGRRVIFEPARLSDIESVGSEMERRNSDENIIDKDNNNGDSNADPESGMFEATNSEDEFGMKIVQSANVVVSEVLAETVEESTDETVESKAVPILVIEPKVDEVSLNNNPQKIKTNESPSPPLRMEREEEKACLQMSTKGLTIAKNLDYEDIESLPELISPSPPKTPPALPPKPQFKNNTLVLKKIPSPSFLINESHKRQLSSDGTPEHEKKRFGFSVSPKSVPKNVPTTTVRTLTYDERNARSPLRANECYDGTLRKNKFNSIRSSFQSRQNQDGCQEKPKMAKVTNIVRHFEEFKIGEAEERGTKDHRTRDKHLDFDQDFDIRQNFEEFNLDDCDLSDDPDRAEADGSERLGSLIASNQTETGGKAIKDSNLNGGYYDHFLEATGLSNKSILTPSRLLSNHKSVLKPKDVKYKNKIKATAILEKHGVSVTDASHTHVRHWTGPFV